MRARLEVRRFEPDLLDDAAGLIAAGHRAARHNQPELDPAFEAIGRAREVAEALLARDDASGAIAYVGGKPAGCVLMVPRPETAWGPNAWAEDGASAGEPDAVRAAYAAVAGDLVAAGRRRHFALVPSRDEKLIDAWFSLGFGLQHVYAAREPVGADFEPSPREDLRIRRADARDVRALAALDVVLPEHLRGAPVFSDVPPANSTDIEAEILEDLANPQYAFFVAEQRGEVIAMLVATPLEATTSWGPLMRPVRAAFLGYAATFPAARGLGAGRALTEHFFAWSRDGGYDWLATDWRSANLEADRTWRAMGFRPLYLRLHRAIA
jgi:GNAT superfamily N-acetyltransferase